VITGTGSEGPRQAGRRRPGAAWTCSRRTQVSAHLAQQPKNDVADDFESTSSLLAAQRGQTIEVVNQAARLMSAIVVGGVTAVITLVASSGSNEGTVVAKGGPIYDYAYCPTGTVVGPMGIATLGSCSSPTCWRVDIRDSLGNTTALCVRRELYDAAQLGTFWQEPTDR
jgi:hypothetical protein